MNTLFVIPARGGSKGIPGKNIKPLAGKPLIHYSIEYARLFAPDEDILVSSDSDDIRSCAMLLGLPVNYIRPSELATDSAGTYEVLIDALQYASIQKRYDRLVLLQPTSPLREKKHLEEALKLFNKDLDMVVSVTETAHNPYFNLFEESADGFLHISKGQGDYKCRQAAPEVFAYNGSIYIINTASLLKNKRFNDFKKIVKYIMEPTFSVDIDNPSDWILCEEMLNSLKDNDDLREAH
jgi:CMP-N,N'-diacetyllegionaminic acid synthase